MSPRGKTRNRPEPAQERTGGATPDEAFGPVCSRAPARVWIGLALASVSWLLGLHFFAPPRPIWWTAALLVAVVCLGARGADRPMARRDAVVALVLLLLTAWYAPWPWSAGPWLLAAGLAAELGPIPARWPRWLGRGAIAAGGVLIGQSLALLTYTAHTARTHELPWLLQVAVGWVAQLLGADVAGDGRDLVFRVLGQPHRLGATWELLLDPATLCFYAGGLAILGLAAWSGPPDGRRWTAWLGAARAFSLIVLLWLPVRVGLAMAIYVHRAMLAGTDAQPLVMGQFFSPWFHLLLLTGPVVLASRFVPWPGRDPREEPSSELEDAPAEPEKGDKSNLPRSGPEGASHKLDLSPFSGRERLPRFAATLGLVAAGVALVTVAAEWSPVGRPKPGRIMFVERHSLWEPTQRPYDTTWYGEASCYNYALAYDYLGHWFEMSRLLESDAIDDEKLAGCDVLVVKTPTARYSDKETEAIRRFVAGGGGLLLIGDHTNVFRSSTYLNDIARPMGFTYRNDLLFRIGSPFDQRYERPLAAHPAVQDLPPMDFAVSCSIDPGAGAGWAAIRNTGLWSLPCDYDGSNYHPFAEHRPEMRYGAFVQLWATTHGRGRVLAFTDSTIFSNFCFFQPGKAELLRGMVDWLNYTSGLDVRWARTAVTIALVLAGLVLAAVGTWRAEKGDESNLPRSGPEGASHKLDSSPFSGRERLPSAWLPAVAAGLFGWMAASMGVSAYQHAAMPSPPPARPMTRVVIDRTTSDVPLANAASNAEPFGFGLLEHTIPRLGYYTMRRSGADAFDGDAVVVICPSRSVPESFREELVRFVARGGKLLVIDSPTNEGSTANSLLWPFGLSVDHAAPAQGGTLTVGGRPAGFPVEGACRVSGGEAIARLGEAAVAARAQYEEGTVMAVGFGYVFSDYRMAPTMEGSSAPAWKNNWMLEPDASILARYEVFYALFRGLMTGGAVELPQDAAPKSKTPEAPGVPEAPDVPEAPVVIPPKR